MKPILYLLTLATLALPIAYAQEPAEQKADPAVVEAPATDFIRIDEDDKAARLQTAVTRYEKEGVTVDLIGAVHIADKKYYEDLNKSFDNYDSLETRAVFLDMSKAFDKVCMARRFDF